MSDAAAIAEAGQPEVVDNATTAVNQDSGSSNVTNDNDVAAKDGDGKTDKPAGVLKTTAKIDPKNHSANRKYDPSVLPESDDPQIIRNQVRA